MDFRSGADRDRRFVDFRCLIEVENSLRGFPQDEIEIDLRVDAVTLDDVGDDVEPTIALIYVGEYEDGVSIFLIASMSFPT